MTTTELTPMRLIAGLLVYFIALVGSIVVIGTMFPKLATLLPMAGTDAIEVVNLIVDDEGIGIGDESGPSIEAPDTVPDLAPSSVGMIALYLSLSLTSTILVMIPVSWTYMAIKREVGFRRNFVRALIVLPICATTIVLLIQDSLALAFGLAAMVAAVRFRVALTEAIDGIYIFSAICVGLAAGIGFIGIGAVMAFFFCMTNAVLWHLDYGQNPIDDVRREKKQAKLA